jgi:hypothetical protein
MRLRYWKYNISAIKAIHARPAAPGSTSVRIVVE